MGKPVTNAFQRLYDMYSAMLYGIALEISPSQKEADLILFETFMKAHKQDLFNQEGSSVCVTLIKLVIQTAHEVLIPEELKHNFKLKRFETSPLLHQLLCEQFSIDDLCSKHKLTPLHISKQIREEFNSMRILNEKNLT